MMKYNNIHLDSLSEWFQNSIDQSIKKINSLNFKNILDHDVYDLNEMVSSATKQNNNIQTAFSRMLEVHKNDNPKLASQFDEIYNQYMNKWHDFYNNAIPTDLINQQIRGLENAKKYNYGHRRDDLLKKMNDRTRRYIDEEVSDLNNIVDRKLYEAGYASQYGYNQANKAYTSRYHSNIDGYIHYGGFGNQNFRNHFFNDEAIARYEQIKKQYPDLTLDRRTANYEFDIDKAYEQALDMNERYNYERERKDKTIQRHKDRRQNRKENREWAKKTFYDGKKEYATKEVQRRTEMLENAQNEISKLQEQLRSIDPNSLDSSSIYKRSFIEGEIKTRQERLSFHQEKLANAKADLEKIAPTPKRKRRAARRDPNNDNILESMVTQLETRKHYDQTPWRKKEEAQRRTEQAEQRQAQQQRVKDIRNEQTKINNTNKPYTIDDLKPGDNFVNKNGELFVYTHKSPKNPELGIDSDMYEFTGTHGNRQVFMGNRDLSRTGFEKIDNALSLDEIKDLDRAWSTLDIEMKTINDFSYDPNSGLSMEEFDNNLKSLIEKRYQPAKEIYLNKVKELQEKYPELKVTDRTNKDIDSVEKEYERLINQTGNTEEKIVNETIENMGDTIEETIENTAETVIKNVAEEAGEEAVETIIKQTTGVNVELDGLNKKRTPKKLKKGTGKYKGKTKELYDRLDNSRYWAVDFPGSNGDFAVHGPNGTKRLEKESIDQQRRRRKYEQTRQKYENQSQNTSTLKNTNNTPEPINADEPVNPINPNDGNDSSANMNGSSGGDGSGGSGGNGGNGGDGGSGKKRRKGNSSQADLPKISKLDVDLPEISREGGSISKYLKEFGNMGFFDKVQTIGAAAGAVSEYKNARRQGHGVVSSTIRAGVDFALGEAMGMYYPLFLLAKEAPGMIVKGSEMLYKENRKMNSAANQQIFGGAQFQDTQQLATMRQSGMEMAKMAQYNLQQTLMGNEATYFHR